MKRSHDHTQLKRLAAISLVVVMCLSALPMLAPSASAAGEGTTYVWDGEGSDNLASTAANWYRVVGGVVTNDVAPTSGDRVIFDATSTKDCTWDLDAADCMPYSITIATGYSGTVTQGDVDIGIGEGGYLQNDGVFIFNINKDVFCHGNFYQVGGSIAVETLALVMTGSQTEIRIIQVLAINSLRISGDVSWDCNSQIRMTGDGFVVDEGCRLTILKDRYLNLRYLSDSIYSNNGVIDGDGNLVFQCYEVGNNSKIKFGDVENLIIINHPASEIDNKLTLNDSVNVNRLIIKSNYENSITLDLNGHSITANSITVGTKGAIIGDGTIINAGDFDSSAGVFDFVGHYVQADGGTITLGAEQSIPSLEIASDDGRTATWTMTATGTVSPIVTGLESGVSYRWYLDGVKQGEVKADEHGTIALSYVSTGLHELSVEPTSMTLAMDGMAAAVGIVVVLAVLGGLFSMIGTAFGRLKF